VRLCLLPVEEEEQSGDPSRWKTDHETKSEIDTDHSFVPSGRGMTAPGYQTGAVVAVGQHLKQNQRYFSLMDIQEGRRFLMVAPT
jgi:hypothetical protein